MLSYLHTRIICAQCSWHDFLSFRLHFPLNVCFISALNCSFIIKSALWSHTTTQSVPRKPVTSAFADFYAQDRTIKIHNTETPRLLILALSLCVIAYHLQTAECMLSHTTPNLFPPCGLTYDTNGAKVCAPQGIYCGFQTEHQPSESSLKGDVRHSRIRRQGGRKASLALRHREKRSGCIFVPKSLIINIVSSPEKE